MTAIQKAKAASEEADALELLEGKVLYRMGRYDDCAKKYADREGEGPLTNLLASYVSGDNVEKAVTTANANSDEVQESVELLFNLSCAQLDLGSTSAARESLSKARALAVDGLTPDEEEDTNAEIAAIDVQRATALQFEGQLTEANEIYSRVLRPSEDADVDVTVLAVGCNNLVALRPGGKSLFDSLKRINVASKESLELKLTRKQAVAIAVNKCLLLLQGKKFEECKQLFASLQAKYPGEPRLVLVQAALAFAEKKVSAAEEILKQGAAAHPSCAELVLAQAELYAEQKQPDAALTALRSLPDALLFEPETLRHAVSLHGKQQTADAVALLQRGVRFWRDKSEAQETKLPAVLELAMGFAYNQKHWELSAEAHRLFLEKCNGSDKRVLCRLVESLSYTEPDLA